jgi:glutamine synthetase
VQFVRVCWCDQHGLVRSKTVTKENFERAAETGKDFPSLTIFDTANIPVFYPFGAANELGLAGISGLPDCLLKPDVATHKKLPWVPGTSWVIGDMHLQDGSPDSLCTRQVLKKQVGSLADAGYRLIIGLEIEFYLFRITDRNLDPGCCTKPPVPVSVSYVSHGHQYLSETRADEIEDLLREMRCALLALDLPLAGLDMEWGPGQCEVVLEPLEALAAADAAVLLRSAIKQMAARRGYHATFMTFPKIANIIPSGWHLHQSLREAEGEGNVFAEGSSPQSLSRVAMHWIGGLMEHAPGASILSTPTVNGYKRQRPDSLAPIAAAWGFENRGVMLRVIGAGRDDAHVENRVGEPCANPYLYIASQIISGLDGIRRELSPGEPSVAGYAGSGKRLPESLGAAIEQFRQDDVIRDSLGAEFSRYILRLKEHELNRFQASVTDWEHNEYFEMF